MVLALLALLTGLVGPASMRAIDQARERAHERALLHVLEALPLEAFRSGATLQVDRNTLIKRLPDWPQDRPFELDKPLRYSAEGVAEGGTVAVRLPNGQMRHWRVQPRDGRVIAPGS